MKNIVNEILVIEILVIEILSLKGKSYRTLKGHNKVASGAREIFQS